MGCRRRRGRPRERRRGPLTAQPTGSSTWARALAGGYPSVRALLGAGPAALDDVAAAARLGRTVERRPRRGDAPAAGSRPGPHPLRRRELRRPPAGDGTRRPGQPDDLHPLPLLPGRPRRRPGQADRERLVRLRGRAGRDHRAHRSSGLDRAGPRPRGRLRLLPGRLGAGLAAQVHPVHPGQELRPLGCHGTLAGHGGRGARPPGRSSCRPCSTARSSSARPPR